MIRLALIVWVALLPCILHGQLVWETTRIELKPKIDETSATAIYGFRNAGNTPITLIGVKTSCDCTAVTFEKRAYAPGDTGTVTVIFKFGQRSGKQEKTLLVETSDPQTPTTMLALRVDIPELLRFDPKTVFWPLNGTPEPKTVRIEATGEPVSIGEVKPGSDNFKCHLRTLANGKSFELTLTPKNLSKPGYTAIQVLTKKPIVKTLTLVAGVR